MSATNPLKQSYLPRYSQNIGGANVSVEGDVLLAILMVAALALYIKGVPQKAWQAVMSAEKKVIVDGPGNSAPSGSGSPPPANSAPSGSGWPSNPDSSLPPSIPDVIIGGIKKIGSAVGSVFSGGDSGPSGPTDPYDPAVLRTGDPLGIGYAGTNVLTACYMNPASCMPSVAPAPPKQSGTRVCVITCDCEPHADEYKPAYCT